MNQKIGVVKKYLKRKKINIVMELIVKDYNKSNFYIALIFDVKIEKFKVLFIPLDILEIKNIDRYVCYQFIHIPLVHYILETIKDSKKIYEKKAVRDKVNSNIESYYIEINTHVGGEDYTFTATQYIPKEWIFMFEIIVILFEHVPNIVSELCQELLAAMNDSADVIEYKTSVNLDLFHDNLDVIFTKSSISKGTELYQNGQVKFIEKVNGKYFAIVREHIVIVEYNENKKILNLSCDFSCHIHGRHIYAVVLAILNHVEIPFYKLMVVDHPEEFLEDSVIAKYYLCYGLDGNQLKVIHGSEEKLLSISMVQDGLIKITCDPENKLEKKIIMQLAKTCSESEIANITKQIRGTIPR